MKKLMMLVAMLALLLVAAIPAIAQVSEEFGQEIENTGNVQNAQGFLQYASTSDDIEFEGSSMTFAPTLTNTCNQAVQQSAAAGP